MSFMFNPYPYDDPNAVNHIHFGAALRGTIMKNTNESVRALMDVIGQKLSSAPRCILGIDGYISAPMARFTELLARRCAQEKIPFTALSTESLFLESELLNKKLLQYLPEDRETDPVLIYGALYHEGYEGLMDASAISSLATQIKAFSKTGTGILIVHGNGTLIDALRPLYDLKLYIDMTPKRTILNIRSGSCGNLGSTEQKPMLERLRRSYYVDFEAAAGLRGQLMCRNEIDYYLTGDHPESIQLLPLATVKELFRTMLSYPLRCRPVYLEGVWGGFYIKHLRRLPEEMRNCAWVFDLIPMEVSIAVDIGDVMVEFPFYCFVQTVGSQLMGEKAAEKFGNYFPIRFNYDDTFHSSGNMSIQVHPDAAYVRKNNNELGRQDESYYIVATGQQAKTYIGFKNGANVEEFIEKARRAEKYGEGFNYDDYVNSVPSRPGMQFMIPAGTIHASGRNQVILEIGSLTIGSYTYKMYDYMRKDLDGNLRPIHIYHGDNVLRRDFTEDWVMANLVQNPRTIREGDGYKEVIVGEHDLLYFSLRNLIFSSKIEDETTDRFHVLVLVDGEKVLVRSLRNPEHSFEQNYLDMVIVPAGFGPYEIVNVSGGVVIMHKTLLKDGFENE